MLIKTEDGVTLGEIARAYQAGTYTRSNSYSLVAYRLDEDGNCSANYDIIFTLSDRKYRSDFIANFMFETLLKLHDAILAGDDSVMLPIKKGKLKKE